MTNEEVTRYREMDVWRSVPNPADRIRCMHLSLLEENQMCNGWIGRREPFSEGDYHLSHRCTDCERETCQRCGRALDGSPDADPEGRCSRTADMAALAADEEGEERGVTFQICPHCGARERYCP